PCATDDDGLARYVDAAMGLQLLQHAASHLARATDDTRKLLPRDADLRAVRVAHRVGFLAQVEQNPGDPIGDVHERHAADLPRRAQQAVRQLQPDREENARAVLAQRAGEQLEQLVVAYLGQFAGAAGADQHFALRLLDEQSHFPDELAAVDVGEDQLAALL